MIEGGHVSSYSPRAVAWALLEALVAGASPANRHLRRPPCASRVRLAAAWKGGSRSGAIASARACRSSVHARRRAESDDVDRPRWQVRHHLLPGPGPYRVSADFTAFTHVGTRRFDVRRHRRATPRWISSLALKLKGRVAGGDRRDRKPAAGRGIPGRRACSRRQPDSGLPTQPGKRRNGDGAVVPAARPRQPPNSGQRFQTL